MDGVDTTPDHPLRTLAEIVPEEEEHALAEYEAELAAAAASSSAAPAIFLDAVPRLPLDDGPDEKEPHRDRKTWHPPCCIARTLSRKEMESCPKARKALDAEWERLRFLKRPHPTKGVGAWDEGNVREASSVRKEAQQAGKTVHLGRIVIPTHPLNPQMENICVSA